MSQSFYYGTDIELRTGALNFAARLDFDPEAYGVTQQQAEEIFELAQAYSEAYVTAATATTRTTPAVLEKNRRKQLLKDAARRLGNLIIANPAVNDAQISGLGLKPRVGRKRIYTPDSTPQIFIRSMSGHRIDILIRDDTLSGRGKPKQVAGAAIWMYTGDDVPGPDSDRWVWYGNTTRTNTTIQVPSDVSPGTQVWLCAAWYNNRQQKGAVCRPIVAYVQFGGPMVSTGGLRRAA